MKTWLIPLILLLAACSNQSTKTSSLPGWVTELPVRDGWVYGVGSAELIGDPAKAAQLARNRARLDLLASLKVNIGGRTDSLLSVNNNEVERRFNQRLTSKVPEIELETLTQIDSYIDQTEQRVFVLMGLSRAEESSRLRRQMVDLEQTITDWQMPTAIDRLEQLQQLGRIMQSVAQWQPLADRFRLISGRSIDPLVQQQVVSLQQQLRDVLASLKVELTATGEQSDRLAAGLGERLTTQGLYLVPDQGDLLLLVETEVDQLNRQGNDYVFINAQIALSTPQKQILLQSQKTARGVSSLPGQAVNKAMDELSSQLSDALIEALVPSSN